MPRIITAPAEMQSAVSSPSVSHVSTPRSSISHGLSEILTLEPGLASPEFQRPDSYSRASSSDSRTPAPPADLPRVIRRSSLSEAGNGASTSSRTPVGPSARQTLEAPRSGLPAQRSQSRLRSHPVGPVSPELPRIGGAEIAPDQGGSRGQQPVMRSPFSAPHLDQSLPGSNGAPGALEGGSAGTNISR